MTFYEFTALSSDQQLAIVWEQGQFMALRDEADKRIGLHTLGTFFVEVLYDRQQLNFTELVSERTSNRRYICLVTKVELTPDMVALLVVT